MNKIISGYIIIELAIIPTGIVINANIACPLM